MGKCPDCGAWNSFVEEAVVKAPRGGLVRSSGEAVPIASIESGPEDRFTCGMPELDRVLGGGVVPGSLVLIGGDPGIGKSTLLLQAMSNLSRSAGRVLYASGEESAAQTRLRGERLGALSDDLYVLSETSIEHILAQVKEVHPRVLVVDSIQTVYTSSLESAPGSVSQVRECAALLMKMAKGQGIPVFIVGHVTKEGSIAGPRVLEHLVDTVLYFEGDRGHSFRILRAVKNRFGPTNEIGVFEMRDEGLAEVANPSELFLSQRPVGVAGSVVVATMEGTRPLLVEFQGLVTGTSIGIPRRTTLGVDHNRLALLVAVLEKKVGLHLSGQDIYLNAAGGVRVNEPAADLGMVIAVASSHLDRVVPPEMVVVGEVGLAGEVRDVSQVELRIREAAKLGFTRCIIPRTGRVLKGLDGIELITVRSVEEALDKAF